MTLNDIVVTETERGLSVQRLARTRFASLRLDARVTTWTGALACVVWVVGCNVSGAWTLGVSWAASLIFAVMIWGYAVFVRMEKRRLAWEIFANGEVIRIAWDASLHWLSDELARTDQLEIFVRPTLFGGGSLAVVNGTDVGILLDCDLDRAELRELGSFLAGKLNLRRVDPDTDHWRAS